MYIFKILLILPVCVSESLSWLVGNSIAHPSFKILSDLKKSLIFFTLATGRRHKARSQACPKNQILSVGTQVVILVIYFLFSFDWFPPLLLLTAAIVCKLQFPVVIKLDDSKACNLQKLRQLGLSPKLNLYKS